MKLDYWGFVVAEILVFLLALWNPYIERYAAEFDVDPQVVRALIWTESYGDSDAAGSSGERGLCQIMPDTAEYISNLTSWDAQQILYDPETNIRAGVFLFAQWYHRFESVDLALSAYNGGARYVIEHGSVNPHTAHYVWKVRDVLGWNIPSEVCVEGRCLVERMP